ncbi:MAG: LeuA family protein [Leptospiraceae bacterium]|nr:2-isopropylmalate synthase [Leptospiraceae bacterium]MCK6381622.1 LeuA family protein [Leptospiraceae bacterium]NUM40819.1 2-isopropylmalate synthase [Leptospiraceae bacterium]
MKQESKFPSPFFMDVTLRDGNQALKKPWQKEEKIIVFRSLLELGSQGVEVGFASASQTDFDSCKSLAKISPPEVQISSLSRAFEKEIQLSWEAIRFCKKPCLHIVYPISPFARKYILELEEKEVLKNIENAVRYAKEVSKGKALVQFSGEHFGDSEAELNFSIDAFHTAIQAGAEIINLANTVERTRPSDFVSLVKKAVDAMPSHVRVSVHTHNDLGMATATTVESYFAGAVQLETALNGLGERAGNTNTYEVACALFNSGVDIRLNMDKIYSVAKLISKMSNIPIHEKAPIIGEDITSHRSGIHQDGVAKTNTMKKGAYRAIDFRLIGREDTDKIQFTSLSGKAAIIQIFKENGVIIHKKEAEFLQPIFKTASEEKKDALSWEEMISIREKFLLSA